MTTFLKTFGIVWIAEMGDKTQFLMIAMASKYKLRQILFGVGAAILLLNALAVGMGLLLGGVLPTATIGIVSGLAFLYFAYASLSDDEKKGQTEGERGTAGGTWTVFGTFFLAELGDKTQLTALTLAAGTDGIDWRTAFPIFLGASVALLAADLLGLLVGYFLGKTLPSGVFSWISFTIFAVFGIVKLLGGLEEALGAGKNGQMLAILITIMLAILFAGLTLRKQIKIRYAERQTNEST